MASKTVLAVMFVSVAALLVGCAAMEIGQHENTDTSLPPAALKAIRAEFPAAAVEEAKWTDEEGMGLFEVELEQGDQDIEVKVTSDGAIAEVERDVKAAELPKAVKNVLAKSAPGEIKEAAKIETRAVPTLTKLASPQVVYEMDIENDRKEGEITVSAAGDIVKLKWESKEEKGEGKDDGDKEDGNKDKGDDEADDEGERHERKAKALDMNMGEIEKVADAIEEQMPQAIPGKVELEKEGGVAVYSVELIEADKKMEAEISRTGAIVQIEMEIAAADVPQAVKAAVEKAAPGARITDAEKQEKLAAVSLVPLTPAKVIYEVKVKGKGEMTIPAEGAAPAATAVAAASMALAAAETPTAEPKADSAAFQDTFPVNKANLVPNGVNPYWIPLVRGARLTYANKKSDSLIITILDETRVVDGVTCCVLEERETEGGQLAEISYNFYAIDKETQDVYYFGEAVDIYEGGKVVKHEGAWKSGEEGDRFGLMMPGKPEVGQRFYQEVAKNAKDRVEIVSVSETVETPAGKFENCVHFLETSPLESGTSTKCFAPGVGMVRDDGFYLTKVEMPAQD